jgi:hypothetical protein
VRRVFASLLLLLAPLARRVARFPPCKVVVVGQRLAPRSDPPHAHRGKHLRHAAAASKGRWCIASQSQANARAEGPSGASQKGRCRYRVYELAKGGGVGGFVAVGAAVGDVVRVDLALAHGAPRALAEPPHQPGMGEVHRTSHRAWSCKGEKDRCHKSIEEWHHLCTSCWVGSAKSRCTTTCGSLLRVGVDACASSMKVKQKKKQKSKLCW